MIVRARAFSRSAVALLASLAISACGGRAPELKQPVGQTTVTSATRSERASNYVPATLDLYLSRQIPGPCGMDRLPSLDFAFGSAELEVPQDLEVMRLAECLRQRPFDTAQIILVGHADPIGSATYNLNLGFDRANRVRSRLVEVGIAPSRIVVTSAGESPLPRERWDEARRVDLVVARPQSASAPASPSR